MGGGEGNFHFWIGNKWGNPKFHSGEIPFLEGLSSPSPGSQAWKYKGNCSTWKFIETNVISNMIVIIWKRKKKISVLRLSLCA